jgi:hypothetical protein
VSRPFESKKGRYGTGNKLIVLGKSLSLSEVIEQVLANAKEKKCTGLTKNLYHFINQEKHEFMAEYDSVYFKCSCLDAKQYAFKVVYMNTFYGTVNPLSSYVNLQKASCQLGRKTFSLSQISLKIRDLE